jgi:reactive intermediate/imine deaminase
MTSRIVESSDAPAASGPFSPAVLGTGTQVLALSGQVSAAPDGSLVGEGDAGEQARQCLRNLDALLRAAGATREDVVRVGIFLTDMADRAAVARARIEYFGDHRPAATLIEVSALVAPEFLVEIEATAVF